MKSAYRRSADVLSFGPSFYARRMPAAQERCVELHAAMSAYRCQCEKKERQPLRGEDRVAFTSACIVLEKRMAIIGAWFRSQSLEHKGVRDSGLEIARRDLHAEMRRMNGESYPNLPDGLGYLLSECNALVRHASFLDMCSPHRSRALVAV